jgi:isopenicillin-N N-acyltransferase like protein
MSPLAAPHSTVLRLTGSPRERGRGQAAACSDMAEAVYRATVARVLAARAEGWITADMRAYLDRQHAFLTQRDPHGMAELAGIAEGFGLSEGALFEHQHLGTLRDLAGGGRIDGCTAWAVGAGPEGPLVVKNRDVGGALQGVQRLMWHDGPDIATGGMMCLGSLGSPGAYSSGMNAAGLALADTQIAARTHRVGWLRYFLMTRLLATCATVDEALAFLRAVPHAGGGSLILADAGGTTAAFELGATHVDAATAPLSWHTNHFLSDRLEDDTLTDRTGRIGANSRARQAFLSATLPDRALGVTDAAALMATHTDGGAPVCQHPDHDDDSRTISCVIYAIDRRCLYLHEGNPCAGHWRVIPLPT